MKIAALVSRYLLGIMFVVFGLNGFFHFLPMKPPTNPVAIQFFTAVSVSHYLAVVFLVQLIAGLLFLSGRFIPLALAILAPVLVNILNYHFTMDPAGLGPGILATVFWFIVFAYYRASFAPLFAARAHEA